MAEYKSLATVIREMNNIIDPAMDAPTIPGKKDPELTMIARVGLAISRTHRNQIQTKIIDG